MKSEGRSEIHAGFGVTKNIIIYVFLLIASLIFTQALRSVISNILFVFVVLLLPLLLIYLLLARVALKVVRNTVTAETEKLKPIKYSFGIRNRFIFPYPFVTAVMRLPQANCIRTEDRQVYTSLGAFSRYRINNEVRFRYRGTYEVGVHSFYVYDFFRIFRMRITVDEFSTIYVLPRRLSLMGETTGNANEDASYTKDRSRKSFDRNEVNDMRSYRIGDSLKNIHWKLSSKSEDFIVRDYDTGASRSTCVFADFSAYYPQIQPLANSSSAIDINELAEPSFYEDMNEFCADAICELTIAAVFSELKNGNNCTLFWYDRRTHSGVCGYTVNNMSEFEAVYRYFATAPLCSSDNRITGLTELVADCRNIKRIYVTSVLDRETVAALSADCNAVTGGDAGVVKVLLYNPERRFKNIQERRSVTENAKRELSEHGIHIIDASLPTRPDGGIIYER